MARNRPSEKPQARQRKIGVVIVDPLPVVRAGLALLVQQADLEVLGDAGTAEEGLELVRKLRRSRIVILVGLGLRGDRDSFWLIRNLRERHPSHTILGCGANTDTSSISRALFVGADGFVDKNVEASLFLRSLSQAADGQVVLAGPSSAHVAEIAQGIDRRADIDARLTRREREVLTVAAEGLTAREIASRLGVRERTVTTHLARIYGKLGVGNRLAAIRTATRSGLVSVGSSE
jgi:DNA-binding NarL/FixJ family response regulator